MVKWQKKDDHSVKLSSSMKIYLSFKAPVKPEEMTEIWAKYTFLDSVWCRCMYTIQKIDDYDYVSSIGEGQEAPWSQQQIITVGCDT